MPKRKQRLPSLPLDASSKEVEVWREKAVKIVEEEVEKRYEYGYLAIIGARAALFSAEGTPLYNTRGARAYDSAMDALGDGDEEDFDKFRRLYLAWLEPYINEAVGEWHRDRAEGLRRGKKQWIDVDKLAKGANHFDKLRDKLPEANGADGFAPGRNSGSWRHRLELLSPGKASLKGTSW